jgi:predicted MFS family arabinose efflux permease
VLVDPGLTQLPVAKDRTSEHAVGRQFTTTRMFSRRLKTGYFALEGLNSFATVYYFYYLYFFMQKAHGFDNKENLMLAALSGATYACASWFSGRFAQRYGYFTALKTGYTIMIAALSTGLITSSAAGQVVVMVLTVIGMSFIWLTLEALVSEAEPREGLQHMVGIYNVVWAGTAALGNFSGGAMLEKLGMASLFYVPIAVHLTQFGLTLWLQSKAKNEHISLHRGKETVAPSEHGSGLGQRPQDVAVQEKLDAPLHGQRAASAPLTVAEAQAAWQQSQTAFGDSGQSSPASESNLQSSDEHLGIPKAKKFLRMAWLANPFAYIAINTLIAVVPGVATRMKLSTMAAGFCCSTWCFARLGAFAVLWRWTRWHYRFRWLLLAYVALVGSFGAVVLAPNLGVLVLAQLIFGSAIGLIYYSSLFYSMDSSETKGESGGIHEAAIGLGNCAGPAVGAVALQLVPQYRQSGTIAVIVLLLCGLGGLLGIWKVKSSGQ